MYQQFHIAILMLETAVKYSAFHSGLCLIIDDTPLLPQPPTDGGRVQTFSKVAYWIRKCISMWQFANLYLLDLVIHLLYCFHSTYQLRIFITFLLSFVHDLHSLFFIHHSASPSARLLVCIKIASEGIFRLSDCVRGYCLIAVRE